MERVGNFNDFDELYDWYITGMAGKEEEEEKE